MAEQLANNAQSTLNGGITNVATTLTVTSGTLFPSTGNFRIIIDTEIILVGARSGNTLSSLTRGQEGTTGASHSNGALVTHILTKGGLDQYLTDRGVSGTDYGMVTSLTGSPVHGDKAILVDSLTAPTYAWPLRYDTGISDANKWVCTGASPAYNKIDTAESEAASGAWVNLATDGPKVTVPRAGVYVATWGVNVSNSTAATIQEQGVALNNGTPVEPIVQVYAASGGHYTFAGGTTYLTGVAASDVIKVRYKRSSSTATWRARWIAVWPLRVA